MNKLKAMMVTGALEVKFQGQEKLLNEVANLQKHILEDDEIHVAIDIGRLKEMANLNISEDANLKELYNSIFLKPKNEKLNLNIEELELTVRTYNCLKRAGINTVNQLVSMSVEDLIKVRQMSRSSIIEIRKKLENLGFELLGN